MIENIIPKFEEYELIDSGDFEKLERFGEVVTRRPEPQAIWGKSLSDEEWREMADASFLRDAKSEERGEWRLKRGTAEQWHIHYKYRRWRSRCVWGSHRSNIWGSFRSRRPIGTLSMIGVAQWIGQRC